MALIVARAIGQVELAELNVEAQMANACQTTTAMTGTYNAGSLTDRAAVLTLF